MSTEAVLSASVLGASTEWPQGVTQRKPQPRCVLVWAVPSGTVIRCWHYPGAAFLCPRETVPSLLLFPPTAPLRSGTQYRGAEPPGSYSAEYNCSDETAETLMLTKSPTHCPLEGQAGSAWEGPPEEPDWQGLVDRYPGSLRPQWTTQAPWVTSL